MEVNESKDNYIVSIKNKRFTYNKWMRQNGAEQSE